MVEEYKIYKIYKTSNQYNKKGDILKVSNFGNVLLNDKPYTCLIRKDGYKYISLIPLHRIVAELFIDNPENKPEVDHIDTDILNNHINNLMWVTRKENLNNPLTRKHNSESMIGKTPWNKNKKYSRIK